MGFGRAKNHHPRGRGVLVGGTGGLGRVLCTGESGTFLLDANFDT